MAFPITTAQDEISQLYVGYFGRAADPDGLSYWVAQLNAGMSLTAIANSFAVQPEATALYAYLAAPNVGDPTTFINAIYQDLFNHTADAAGLAYWINQLTVVHTPPGQMVLNIISGAQGADLTTIQNKTHVSTGYAQDFVNGNVHWIGVDNIAGARGVVTPVDSTQASVDAGLAASAAIVAQEIANPTGTVLSSNVSTIADGGGVDITIHADPSQAGHSVTYTLSGVTAAEIQGGHLSGTVALDSNSTAVVHVGTVVQTLNGADETLHVAVAGPGTVGPLPIDVAVTQGQQAVVAAPNPVNEGSTFTFTVSTTGVAAGSVTGRAESYTISGPGLAQIPAAEQSGTITLDANGNAVVTVHTLANVFNSNQPDPTVTVTVANDPPVTVTIHNSVLQTVTPSADAITEGSSVTFAIATSGADGSAVAGTVETWTLSGSATNQVHGGVLSGTVVLDSNGHANVTVGTDAIILNGAATQGLTFTLSNGGTPVTSANVVVTEGTQTISATPNPVDEGSSFNIAVATTGVAVGSVEGRTEAYTITGPGLAQIPIGERSGTVTLDANGNAVVTVHTIANVFNGASDPTVTVTLANDPPINVTIHEAATQTVTASANPINQGGSVTFTISTAGVNGSAVAGTVETWTLTGAATNQVHGGVLSGTVVLDANGNAAVTVGTDFSVINGPLTQNFTFNLFNGGTPVTNNTVTVNESTITVAPVPTDVIEGHTVTFTITGVNVPSGTLEHYTLSGSALGNVVGPTTGTVTISGNTATVVVQTLSNDLSGLDKSLTLTLDGVNNATGTATIHETGPASFILTTNTDNFTGNPAGGNTFFAVANSDPLTLSSTLGQNDNLNGGGGPGNILNLTTTGLGLLPQTINAFTTHGIQEFDINAGEGFGGTTIDMSSAFGVTAVHDANSSGNLTLLNVTQAITDLQLMNPSDILGGTVNLAVQYQAAALPASQTLTLDPTVSPITGLPNSKFWVNVPTIVLNSIGSGTNGLVSVNGATGPFAATALTSVALTGGTNFVAGVAGSGLAALAFTGNAHGTQFDNVLDLTQFTGTFFDSGAPGGGKSVITAVGGMQILGGSGGMDGIYTPAPGFTGGTQTGGKINVGGDLGIGIGNGTVNHQTITDGGFVAVFGTPLGSAAGGLLNTSVTTTDLGGSQIYNGFNGGLTGSITTNNGFVQIGQLTLVNGVITEAISTGTGQATITGGNGNVSLDFSGKGTTGFHASLSGPNTPDKFTGGTATNTLIIDPMINNLSTANGEGLATGVQNLTLQTNQPTTWDGTVASNSGGGLQPNPTNMLDLGLLNQNASFTGINTGFAQTINVNTRLGAMAQTFKDAVSGDNFIVDNSATPGASGSMRGQTIGFDFALPSASNTLNFTVNNLNQSGSATSVTLRDFDTTGAANQNPVTTLNYTANRVANSFLFDVNNVVTLDTLNRLATLSLQGTADNFANTAATLTILALGGAATLGTITGGNANMDISALAANYLATTDFFVNGQQANTITLGNGADVVTVNAGSWLIKTGAVPGGGVAGDSGNTTITLNPGLGSLDTALSGGGADTYNVGNQGGIVNLSGGAGNDIFNFNMAGAFPGLNSAQTIDGGSGIDGIVLNSGAINQNDSLWGHVTNVEDFTFATGLFNNGLLLNFFANQSGLTDIFTTGGGSSNVVFEGTGFTKALTYHIADGDTGHDAIIAAALPSGSDAITVDSSTAGFNTAFESGLNTNAINPGTGVTTGSGIFGNPNAANTLGLIADNGIANVFGTAGFGVHDVQTIKGIFNGFGNGETVFLANDPALFTKVATVDLSAVAGVTNVWGGLSTTSLAITGGVGSTDVLLGGKAADHITAMGVFSSPTANIIYGGGGADVETGVAGGLLDNTGTVFMINAVSESRGGPQQSPGAIDVSITNFHSATDTLLINPGALTGGGGIPIFVGAVANYGQALASLVAGQNTAVYESDIGALWIDANADQNLDSNDIEIFVNFASPGFQAGSVNFGGLAGLNTTGQITAFFNNTLNPVTNVPFSGTLAPGEFLFANGPGANNSLTLNNGDVENGVLVGFDQLVINSGFTGEVSIAQWNTFASITGSGTGTVKFSDGNPALGQSTFTTDNDILHYDLSKLTTSSVVNVQFNDTFGTTIIGSNAGDTFNVSAFDLTPAGDTTITGGTSSHDTLHMTTEGNVTFDPTGKGSATVSGVEQLVLSNVSFLTNNINFTNGGSFTGITGSTGTDNITTGTMVAGALDLIDLTQGGSDSVFETANLQGTILFTANTNNNLEINNNVTITGTRTGGGSNSNLELNNGVDISGAAVTNFGTLEVNSGASVTMTIPQWNSFTSGITGPGSNHTINFLDAGGSFTTDADIENYNANTSSGVDVTLVDNEASGTINGSSSADTFEAKIGALTQGGKTVVINGQGGGDTLKLLSAGTILIQPSGGKGMVNLQSVENLTLFTSVGLTANTVTFGAGNSVQNVTGGAENDTISFNNLVSNGTVNTGAGTDLAIIASSDVNGHGVTLSGTGTGTVQLTLDTNGGAEDFNTRFTGNHTGYTNLNVLDSDNSTHAITLDTGFTSITTHTNNAAEVLNFTGTAAQLNALTNINDVTNNGFTNFTASDNGTIDWSTDSITNVDNFTYNTAGDTLVLTAGQVGNPTNGINFIHGTTDASHGDILTLTTGASAATLNNVTDLDTLNLSSDADSITTLNSLVTTGTDLHVHDTGAGSLNFNGFAETNGHFVVDVGSGGSVIVSGIASTPVGTNDNDVLNFGSGHDVDTFGGSGGGFGTGSYQANGAAHDIINNFTVGAAGDTLNIQSTTVAGLTGLTLTGSDNFTTSAAIQHVTNAGNMTIAGPTELVIVTSNVLSDNLATNPIAADLNGTALLNAIGGNVTAQNQWNIVTGNGQNDNLFAVADGFGNVGIYEGHHVSGIIGPFNYAANEITLVGVLTDTNINSLTIENFSNKDTHPV